MRTLRLITPLLALVLFFASMTSAQEMPTEAEKAEMMQQAMELAKPGPEHEMLAKHAGTWQTEVKLWMEPGAEPMTVTGVSESQMILGGRFLETTWKTGEGTPMAMEGKSIMGFDRRHGEFTVVGLDTWGTYWVTGQGPYDDQTNTITMYGEDTDPVFGMVQQYDFRMTLVDEDHFTWEVIFYNPEITQGADEFKMVEINYTRKK
ncbi:DUF1579 domain-containing protein [bacterium]|nr:DUF1579 domain-containing protein [bacterium]